MYEHNKTQYNHIVYINTNLLVLRNNLWHYYWNNSGGITTHWSYVLHIGHTSHLETKTQYNTAVITRLRITLALIPLLIHRFRIPIFNLTRGASTIYCFVKPQSSFAITMLTQKIGVLISIIKDLYYRPFYIYHRERKYISTSSRLYFNPTYEKVLLANKPGQKKEHTYAD
jgi:hypothetical protein